MLEELCRTGSRFRKKDAGSKNEDHPHELFNLLAEPRRGTLYLGITSSRKPNPGGLSDGPSESEQFEEDVDSSDPLFLSYLLLIVAEKATGAVLRYQSDSFLRTENKPPGTRWEREKDVLQGMGKYSHIPITAVCGDQQVVLKGENVWQFEAYVRQNMDNKHLDSLPDTQKKTLGEEARMLLQEVQGFQKSGMKNNDLRRQYFTSTAALYRAYTLRGCHAEKVKKLEDLQSKISSIMQNTSVGGEKVYDAEPLVRDINTIVAEFKAYQPDDVFDTFQSLQEDFTRAELRLNEKLQAPKKIGKGDPVLLEKAQQRSQHLYRSLESNVMEMAAGTRVPERELQALREEMAKAQGTFSSTLQAPEAAQNMGAAFQAYKTTLEGIRAKAQQMVQQAKARKYHHSDEGIDTIHALYRSVLESAQQIGDQIRLPVFREKAASFPRSIEKTKYFFDIGERSVSETEDSFKKRQTDMEALLAKDRTRIHQIELGRENYDRIFTIIDQAYFASRDPVPKQEYEQQRQWMEESWQRFAEGSLDLPGFNDDLARIHGFKQTTEKKELSRYREDASLRSLLTDINGILQPVVDKGEDELKKVAQALLHEARSYYEAYRTGSQPYAGAHQQIGKDHSDAQLLSDALGLKQHQQGLDFYQVLGVERSADTDDIKSRYRALARILHPDKVADQDDTVQAAAEAQFKLVDAAYQVLANDISRKQYDDTLNR